MTPAEAQSVVRFRDLFTGYAHAYGTGTGGWVHKAPTLAIYAAHVEGRGPGLGIGPLLPDGTCWFAAIDLDRPDFKLAQELMALLPGVSWLERSRSGNAHVLVFFWKPIEAWVPRGIMREALAAVGEKNVEVFPKSDVLHPGMVGNYLNLPYYGDTRPVVASNSKRFTHYDYGKSVSATSGLAFQLFVDAALADRNDPEEWRKRSRWLGLPSPQERKASQEREFGSSPNLHRCAAYIIEHRDDHPVIEGHRAAVYFALAKMLSNWSEVDHDEALTMMALVNDSSPDPISSAELNRILFNAERGEYTSTGCDDPLVLEYRDPDCKIGA